MWALSETTWRLYRTYVVQCSRRGGTAQQSDKQQQQQEKRYQICRLLLSELLPLLFLGLQVGDLLQSALPLRTIAREVPGASVSMGAASMVMNGACSVSLGAEQTSCTGTSSGSSL